MEENKHTICRLLATTLASTRQFYDLYALTYDEETETVECRFVNGGTKKVNVAADSGAAMIRDILKAIS